MEPVRRSWSVARVELKSKLGEEAETGLRRGGGRNEGNDVTLESKQKLKEGNTVEAKLGDEAETGLKRGGGRNEGDDVTLESKQKLKEGNTVEAEPGAMGAATTWFELSNETESESAVKGGVSARCGMAVETRVLASVGPAWSSLSRG